MKSNARFVHRVACTLVGLATGACWSVAHAQTVMPATAAPPSWSAANLPGVTAFQDKYIGASTAADVSQGDAETHDDQGLARSLQIDGVMSSLSSHEGPYSSKVSEDGFIAKSQWETAAYGAWSLDGSVHAGASQGPEEHGQGGTVTLRQRGMPFDGGWQADNALGDVNTPDINLARLQPRFYLPTSPIQGLTTDWRGPDGLQVTAGGGVPGMFEGIVVPNFRTLGGAMATAGAQWSPAAHWTVGGQVIDANDVNLAVGPAIDGSTRLTSATGLMSAAYQDGNRHLDFNLLDGDVSGKANGLGGWVDGSVTQGRFQHDAGIFRIDPNLTWGNQLIANDMEGGYYRLGYQGRRWLTDVGIDQVRSVSGLGGNTTFLTGDSRYQLSRDWGIGEVANLSRNTGGNSWSLQGFLDHPNRWGNGRAQLEYAHTMMGDEDTLMLNQAWGMPVGIRLNTSASVERINGAVLNGLAQNTTLLILAVDGGGHFTGKLGVEGNVNWSSAVQGRAAPGVSANVSLTYQISRSWELLATYYESQAGSWTPLTVNSPLAPPVAPPIPAMQERGVFLTLRYKRAAGMHFAPLGGAPGAGAGEIAGMVYLDANNNGQFEAGEAGAPNVTVILDGRFSAQTDANGRFSFPVVVTGHHVIKVVSDNLPLPWALAAEGRTEVEVTTRGRTDVKIGAQRLR